MRTNEKQQYWKSVVHTIKQLLVRSRISIAWPFSGWDGLTTDLTYTDLL